MPGAVVAPDANPYGPQLEIATNDVPPPMAVYLSPQDQIKVTSYTDLVQGSQDVSIRLLLPDGQLKLIKNTQLFLPVGSAGMVYLLPPVEGYLLGLEVLTNAQPPRRCWTVVDLVNGLQSGTTLAGMRLCSGYSTGTVAVCYPYSTNPDSVDGQGALLSVTTTVGAGLDWALGPVNSVRWKIRMVNAVLNAGAAVASRTPLFYLRDASGNYMGAWNTGAAVTAGQLMRITTGPTFQNGIFGSIQTAAMPPDLILEIGWTLGVLTAGLQPADQWSGIRATVEQWVAMT